MSLAQAYGDDGDLVGEDVDQQQLSDDDENLIEEAEQQQSEQPLLLAIDDLEGRVVAALDDVSVHPGVKTSDMTLHEELATILRPVLEIAAHTGPSIARTYYTPGQEDASVELVWERVVSDLLLPVLLETAQSDRSPAKRAACLEFFHMFYKECNKAGSWFDTKRQNKRLAREGEILRYWVEASIACTLPGVFTSEEAEGAVASRGILAASASLRPSLTYIAIRIKDADDRGANRLYGPVMRMVEGVLKKCFLSTPSESILSACIKFLEILIMCCSRKPQDSGSRRSKHASSTEGFSLEDLPAGHPVITREALESIAEYAATALRGLALLGGQVKVDVNLLSDMMLGESSNAPSAQVVSILKPAALAYLEIESSLPSTNDDALEYAIDRSSLEFDFVLAQKSYSLTINALSALAVHRPVFYKQSALCLARRAVQPPVFVEGGVLTKPAVSALTVQLKGSCLTLLRNALSVTSNVADTLHKALKSLDMEVQADKALAAAKQATALKSAGRAARNRANLFYEWDASEGDRTSKRQRETDDALAKMRAAKAARGLGHGIQLPSSMADAVDLIMANLENLPSKRPADQKSKTQRKVAITLDYVVDAVMSHGASLSQEEGRWYDRDGGTAWSFDEEEQTFEIGPKLLETLESLEEDVKDEQANKRQKLFKDQCDLAASNALARIVTNASYSRSKSLADLGNQIAARLAFTLNKIDPAPVQKTNYDFARECSKLVAEKIEDTVTKEAIEKFVDTYRLAATDLVLDAVALSDNHDPTDTENPISTRLLNEALLKSDNGDGDVYESCLNLWVASTVQAGVLANEKPIDNERKRAAARCTAHLQRDMPKLPRLSKASLLLVCALCDVEMITVKAAEAAKKTSQDMIAASAAAHAAKVAAEKRATAALLILRDAAFQRDNVDTRMHAVECAVAVASGSLPSVPAVQEKALKLTMNVLYAKNDAMAKLVVQAAKGEIEKCSKLAIEKFELIQKANDETDKEDKTDPLKPHSDEEKQVMDRMRRPVILYMALCVRQPQLIQDLFRLGSLPKANSFSKTIRSSMSKLARATGAKHGAADVAMQVASMCTEQETPMLLSFLENLDSTEEDVIEACYKIQEAKAGEDGKKDPRYIIPVVSAIKRQDLVDRLPEFVNADDNIFLAALVRMGDRLVPRALLFRDEPEGEAPPLKGMTLCEQLVYLHKLDFQGANVERKRYLSVIKLCLEDDQVYTDRVVMAALDYMSGTFLNGSDSLPLAFMRTVILTCTKHESLHSWICHVLLPRLVEGKIYEDARQWEGFMRCAHMLEKSDDPAVNNVEALEKLPPEQLMQYQTKWAGS